MEIKKVSELLEAGVLPPPLFKQLKDIFFESASIKEFSSPEAKEQFFQRWCGVYLDHWSNYCLVALENEQLMGYLVGCPDSTEALNILTMPGYAIFSEYFELFPAHLHMNIHFSTRGSGVGRQLLDYFCKILQEQSIPGVFIITAAMSRPTLFYMKNNFNYSFTKDYGSSALILMGKKIAI